MSKMSQIHAELSEQASELGFESIDDAMNNGYEVIYDGENFAHLVRSEDEQELAHQDWLNKREEVIKALENAIDFIKKGEV